MPQIAQIGDTYFSQLFWLLIFFGAMVAVVGYGMMPKIQSTVDLRDDKIEKDLALAQSAREEAEAKEASWRAKMDEARAEAARLTQDAKAKSAAATEDRVAKAADMLSRKIEAAEAQVRASADAARVEIEKVAADSAQQMVERLTGLKVDAKLAAQAVKAELNG